MSVGWSSFLLLILLLVVGKTSFSRCPVLRKGVCFIVMPNDRFFCSSCIFNSASLDTFSIHCKRVHRNEKNFRIYCSLQQCPYSSKNMRYFRQHVKRNHPYTNDEHQSSDDEYDIHPDNILFRKQQDILAAKFSISLETEHKLSQRGTDDVISSTKLLFDETLFEYKKNLSKTMHNHGIPTDVLDEVPLPDVFSHLSTQKGYNQVGELHPGSSASWMRRASQHQITSFSTGVWWTSTVLPPQ